MKYSLDALEDQKLARADRVLLMTPMIGITRFARFAGLAGLPAVLPPFAKAAWLSVVPEFNPFKYNSFPVNGARESQADRRVTGPDSAPGAFFPTRAIAADHDLSVGH